VTAAALAVQLLGRGSIVTEYVRRCAQPVSNVLTPQLFIPPWRQRSLVNLRLHESPHIGVGQDAALNFGATTGRRAGDVFATGHLPGVMTSTVSAFSIAANAERSAETATGSRAFKAADRSRRRRVRHPERQPCWTRSANLVSHVIADTRHCRDGRPTAETVYADEWWA
jgi:hypothetical protein